MKYHLRILLIAGLCLLASSTKVLGAEDGATTKPIPEAWRNLSLNQFADEAIRQAISPEVLARGSISQDLLNFAWDQYLSKNEIIKTADAPTLFKLVTPVITKLTVSQRQQIAQTYYNCVFDGARTVTPEELIMVGWGLINSGLAQNGKDFPEFAQAVSSYAPSKEQFDEDVATLQWPHRADDYVRRTAVDTYLSPFWHAEVRKTIDDHACAFYRSLFSDNPIFRDYAATYFQSVAFESPSARAMLRAKLIETNDEPNIGVAKVLAWAYHRPGGAEEASWIAFLDQKINDKGITGDKKARWYIARTIAEQGKSSFPDPLSGRKYLDQALSTADSQTLRLQITISLAQRTAADGHFAQAKTLLASRAQQFTDSSQQQIQAEMSEIAKGEKTQSALDAQSQRAQELSRLQGEVASLHQRLGDPKMQSLSAAQKSEISNAISSDQAKIKTLEANQ